MLDVVFDHSETVAKDIFSFWFRADPRVRFVAGQFIELYLPHDSADDRGAKRWFTLSSSPEDDLVSITTRIIDESSTFKKTLANLAPNTKLKIANPMGDFVLPKDASIPLLFVAGGIGCTPFHSIIKYLQDTNQERDIRMLYSANDLESVAFSDTFTKLGKNFEILLTNPPTDWKGRSGRLDANLILEASENGKRHIYVSGPEPMVEALYNGLVSAGIDKNIIHGDYFPGYQSI